MGVRFKVTTNDPCPADDAIVKVLVRWAIGKNLPNRLPNLSIISLSYRGKRSIDSGPG